MIVRDYRTPRGRIEPSGSRFSVLDLRPIGGSVPDGGDIRGAVASLFRSRATRQGGNYFGSRPTLTFVCVCGVVFESRHPQARSCSAACRKRLERERRRLEREAERKAAA